MIKLPNYLKPGDFIALTCPAGYMPEENIQECSKALQEAGFEVIIGRTVGGDSQNYFSGTDEERLDEFQDLLDTKEIKAILCARGGYGTGRIIDRLNFKKFAKKPKWIIGFSDITVLHSHILKNYYIASMHAPMAAAFQNGENEFNRTLLSALSGEKTGGTAAWHPMNRAGTAKGKLVGGNLSLLAHLCGTASDIKTKNCILFLEDIGEQLYNIDRMFYQLKRTGKLAEIAGLVIGGFTELKDTTRPFGKDIYEIVTAITGDLKYPVCFNFPVSHGVDNVSLKIGAKYRLTVNAEGSQLIER